MKTMAFDGIVREMSEVSTRRGVFRLLGGAAAMSAGLVLGGESLAKGKNHGKAKAAAHRKGQGNGREALSAQGKKKTITICYQTQTRTVKKKGYQSVYPGATVGACPVVDPPKPQPEPQPQPVACTRWLISGGPNQYDPIVVDDDFYIFRPSKGGASIINDADKKASSLPPATFDAEVGEVLNIVAYDNGACRSLSPLWLHCLATGQKRVLFTGVNQGSCVNGAGTFINQSVTVSL